MALALVALMTPTAAHAQATTRGAIAGVQDAQVHFERGIGLADDSNYSAAMVEFHYAYRITHNPLLLYNIALAQQALGRYVEALESMRAYESGAGAQMAPARRAEVRAAIQRLEGRIGTLIVPLTQPGLEVRIDGAVYDAAQAHAGIQVSVGTHLVAISARGFDTREQRLDVVSSMTSTLDRPLTPVTAGIALDANIPGAEVTVDGHVVGRTPIASAIPVVSGRHHLEVRRPGYTPYVTDVDVGEQGTRINAQLAWLEPVPPTLASHLAIEAHPEGARALVDGRAILFDGRENLPPGEHELTVERTDFAPITQRVTLEPTRTRRVEAWLRPTALHARHLENQRSRSGRYAVIGAALFVVGVGVTVAGVIDIANSPSTTGPLGGIGVGWPAIWVLASLPTAITGLAVSLVTTVRYLIAPRPSRYDPPSGRPPFRLSVGGEAPHQLRY